MLYIKLFQALWQDLVPIYPVLTERTHIAQISSLMLFPWFLLFFLDIFILTLSIYCIFDFIKVITWFGYLKLT